MVVNPVTVTVSDYHLRRILTLMEKRLGQLKPGSATYTSDEGAFFALVDAYNAAGKAKGRVWRTTEEIARHAGIAPSS